MLLLYLKTEMITIMYWWIFDTKLWDFFVFFSSLMDVHDVSKYNVHSKVIASLMHKKYDLVFALTESHWAASVILCAYRKQILHLHVSHFWCRNCCRFVGSLHWKEKWVTVQKLSYLFHFNYFSESVSYFIGCGL